jgi:hypothetical protein
MKNQVMDFAFNNFASLVSSSVFSLAKPENNWPKI